MKIWIDGDACPKPIKNILFKVAIKKKIEILFIANSFLYLPDSDYIKFVQVEQGPDVADDKIANNCNKGDLVITADILLAARIVSKGAIGLDPRGKVYNENNIGEILDNHNFLNSLRDEGIIVGGPKIFSIKESGKFANELDKIIMKVNNNRNNND